MDQNKLIIACSVPWSGHYIALLRLCSSLNKKGYQIWFCTSHYQIPKLSSSHPKINFYGLNDNLDEIMKTQQDLLRIDVIIESWYHDLKKFIMEKSPVLILADIFTIPPMQIAEQLKIKLVINNASGIEMFGLYNYPDFRKSIQIGGFTIMNPLNHYQDNKLIRQAPFLGYSSRYVTKNLVLVSSFYGLQEMRFLPPNIKLIGNLLQKFSFAQQYSEDLKNWLQKNKKLDKDIIYVTFGSSITLSQKFIHQLYYGLKSSNYAILWSLKQGEQILPQKNQNFYVRKWLQQRSLINQPQVKIIVTHCGWGGYLQCLDAQKPVIAVPGFADHPIMAKIVQMNDLGVVLRWPPQIKLFIPILIDPIFKAQQLKNLVVQMLQPETYLRRKSNIKRFKQLCEEAGGLQRATYYIQNVIKNGIEHMIDPSVEILQKYTIFDRINFVKKVSLGLVSISAIIYFRKQIMDWLKKIIQ